MKRVINVPFVQGRYSERRLRAERSPEGVLLFVQFPWGRAWKPCIQARLCVPAKTLIELARLMEEAGWEMGRSEPTSRP